MANLTTIEKFEFLSIGSWLVDLKAVRDPLNLQQLEENLELSKEQTYEAALISCRSRSEERLSLHFAHGFWICILPE